MYLDELVLAREKIKETFEIGGARPEVGVL